MTATTRLMGVFVLCSSLVIADRAIADGQARSAPVQESGSSQIRSGLYRSRLVTYVVENGRNLYEGDIILEKVEPLADPNQIVIESVTVAYRNLLWPKVGNVFQVPFIVTNGATNLNSAIAEFNNTFTGLIG